MSDSDIKLFVIKSGKQTKVIEHNTLISLGYDFDKLKDVYPNGELWEIWLKEATGKLQAEITRKMRVNGIMDPDLESAARASVMIEKWNGPTESPSIESFLNLPATVTNVINQAILVYMYPSIAADTDFFSKLSPLPVS